MRPGRVLRADRRCIRLSPGKGVFGVRIGVLCGHLPYYRVPLGLAEFQQLSELAYCSVVPRIPVRLSLLVAALALFSATCAVGGGRKGSDRLPNVVIILADDMGYGDPGCFADVSRIPTPHIDRLAREGMRFTDAHAAGAWCVPSRYGLLTGRYPCRRGKFSPNRESVIAPDCATLASLMREHGYATAMVGKWHLGFDGVSPTSGEELTGGPLDRGFDDYFGIPSSLDIPPYYYIRGRRPVAPPTLRVAASATAGWTPIQGAFWRAGGIAPGFVHSEVLGRMAGEAESYLDERASQDAPFFLYLALAAPHTPWLPDASVRDDSGAGMYGDFVSQVDDQIGRVLAALDRNGLAEDTLVLFTSDNGPVWYPQDVERFGHSSVGPLRGMKSDSWEGGHRMPFVVRWPGQVPASTETDQLVCFTDLMATMAELVGASMPDGVGSDSHSLLPVLQDPGAATTRSFTILKANASVARMGHWKLITHLGSGGFSRPRRVAPGADGIRGQLYDLSTDLAETTNLWLERPEIVEQMTARLQAARERQPQ